MTLACWWCYLDNCKSGHRVHTSEISAAPWILLISLCMVTRWNVYAYCLIIGYWVWFAGNAQSDLLTEQKNALQLTIDRCGQAQCSMRCFNDIIGLLYLNGQFWRCRRVGLDSKEKIKIIRHSFWTWNWRGSQMTSSWRRDLFDRRSGKCVLHLCIYTVLFLVNNIQCQIEINPTTPIPARIRDRAFCADFSENIVKQFVSHKPGTRRNI